MALTGENLTFYRFLFVTKCCSIRFAIPYVRVHANILHTFLHTFQLHEIQKHIHVSSCTHLPVQKYRTVLALIIQTAKNNYYNCSALNRKQLNYARVAFGYIRAVLPPVYETKMERFLTTMKKAQTSILTFAMEVPRHVTSPSSRQQQTCLWHHRAPFHQPGVVCGIASMLVYIHGILE